MAGAIGRVSWVTCATTHWLGRPSSPEIGHELAEISWNRLDLPVPLAAGDCDAVARVNWKLASEQELGPRRKDSWENRSMAPEFTGRGSPRARPDEDMRGFGASGVRLGAAWCGRAPRSRDPTP